MAIISRINHDNYGYGFVSEEFLPSGKNEYWLRDRSAGTDKTWRGLYSSEREILAANNNSCSDWNKFLVSDPFDPSLIKNSAFYGLVRVGSLRKVLLQHHDFRVPAGIRNSTIISCDIGSDTAIQDCSYISHYIIGSCCILSRIDEMQTTNHAKFGSGALKDGEEEQARVWIDVMNEAGGRSILPFAEMLPADAFLWACYRDDTGLTDKLKSITQKEYGGYRGAYGVIGSHSVIKSSRIIKDVYVGSHAYIKGANKLKNISVLSSEDEPSQIGEGVEMVNGIVGYGCHAFYGIKAVRFVMGRCSTLKYGARLVHSVLGDNSTVSCCEILNNLIFPFHEQHHNNSFLVASLVQGMSNMAAGATVGSNHNSRANDGEIRAGRGFWPGLSVTLKHSSRFASFILVTKGNYPYELNITLPFSLVNNNASLDRLEIMPAYFWMYNLYALERNSWKAGARDRRVIKEQYIETDYLAPDTAGEIIAALSQMENWMNENGISLPAKSSPGNSPSGSFAAGDNIDPEYTIQIEDEALKAAGLERHSRSTVILKPRRSYAAYREMLLYYSLKTLAAFLEETAKKQGKISYAEFVKEMETKGRRVTEWVNLGGQIAPAFRVDELREKIRKGEIAGWKEIHAAYKNMAENYSADAARHAWEVYRFLYPDDKNPLSSPDMFKKEMENLVNLYRSIAAQVYLSRARDYSDPFREITFRGREEMEQVIKTAADNPFVGIINERTKQKEESIRRILELIK